VRLQEIRSSRLISMGQIGSEQSVPQRGFRGSGRRDPYNLLRYDIYGNKMSETEHLQASRPVHKRAEETRT